MFESKGWKTEALIVFGALLLAAGLGDVAQKFDLPHLADAAGQILGFAALGLAIVMARARQASVTAAKKDDNTGN